MLHVFKHELRLIFRDPKFWIPFVIPAVILAASQGIAVSWYGGQIMEGMEGYIMLLLGCLMAPMGSPLAGDSFAGERERNSLELLQLSPIAPTRLFLGKALGDSAVPCGVRPSGSSYLLGHASRNFYGFGPRLHSRGTFGSAAYDVFCVDCVAPRAYGTCGDPYVAFYGRADSSSGTAWP